MFVVGPLREPCTHLHSPSPVSVGTGSYCSVDKQGSNTFVPIMALGRLYRLAQPSFPLGKWEDNISLSCGVVTVRD